MKLFCMLSFHALPFRMLSFCMLSFCMLSFSMLPLRSLFHHVTNRKYNRSLPDANCQGLFNHVYKKVTFSPPPHEADA